ncbi:Gfo/Idh/MocA family protein [Mangrovibrevibacter kandeliae]|uniref:Gfo/Idh/MocA family protein n=1 Tax=Mangrovibrevibacter kandeliae TaxID=2968473 RepID=UPI002118350F|nr:MULTISPECIES: Gfo/Idh/MocA family oxidoreductase [unclassified Aurantimonas]MCQ8781844.1 Gfo/Idh/MocA family oxidoreductase [Aurantimonas sp. CSK15Z-1]MCW4115499.1 Gfo/Idh/MocA family oxidoreductase [Aurantimonas sp. MSK8Z-1]
MPETIRVGIIGASASGGWARESHVPAVQRLDGLELAAVATSSIETAEAAAAAFGAPKAYGSGAELIGDPDIDLVTVATRVPDHRALVLAAAAQGKHVYCEWPLGRGLAEAEVMALAARQGGVHTAIGLQLRASPAVKRAQDLISSGAVGRVLGLNVVSATEGFGPRVPEAFLYLEEPEAFANLVTIQGAHTLDLAIALGGALTSASALTTAQFPQIQAGETGERRSRATFDHLLVQGRLAGRSTLGLEVAGGRAGGLPFRVEVSGEAGVLRLEGGAPRGAQSSVLTLSLNGEPQAVDGPAPGPLPQTAVNVAGVYAELRDDILGGTWSCPGFDHAVSLTRLVEDLFESSRSGTRREASGWPTA